MKVKIKGLVFVGFAAAILSANAMAANEANTVTSKAYTEATYQHKSTAASIGGENGEWTPLVQSVPDQTSEANAATALSTNAVVDALNDLTAGLNVNANLQGEKYVEIEDITNDQNQVIGHKVVLDGTEITDTGTLSADSDNLVTENAIKSYADSKVTVALGNTTTEAPSGQAVTNAVNAKLNHKLGADGTQANPSTDAGKVLVIDATGEIRMSDATGANTYQSKSTNAKLAIADGNGGWTTLDTKVGGGTYVTATANDTTGAVNFDVTGDQITQSYNAATWNTQGYSDNLTTEAAVAGAINAATGGTVIPAMNTSVCNAQTPCALVAEANGKVHWRVMAVSDPQATAAGTCGDVGGCGE